MNETWSQNLDAFTPITVNGTIRKTLNLVVYTTDCVMYELFSNDHIIVNNNNTIISNRRVTSIRSMMKNHFLFRTCPSSIIIMVNDETLVVEGDLLLIIEQKLEMETAEVGSVWTKVHSDLLYLRNKVKR